MAQVTNNHTANPTAQKPTPPQDPLGRSLANQRTEKKLARVVDKLRRWAHHHRATLALGANDPIVDFIYQFARRNPPTNFGTGHIAASGILLISTIDSEIFVTHEDLESWFGVGNAHLIRYYNEVFATFQRFVDRKVCALSDGVRRRQILVTTPLNVVKTVFKFEGPPTPLIVVNANEEEVQQLLPGNEYYVRKVEVPAPPAPPAPVPFILSPFANFV